MLGLHPRTLQRYLEVEGTRFDALRDDVQRELAQRYLCETRIPMTPLAGLLDYAEQSVQTRACRRWFGQTPSALRRHAPSPPERRGRTRRPAPARERQPPTTRQTTGAGKS